MLRAILLAVTLAFPAPALADITGPARIIDGDTLDIAGQHIRLSGIDAPESRQTCIMDNQPWRCGEAATEALRRLMRFSGKSRGWGSGGIENAIEAGVNGVCLSLKSDMA